MSDRTPADQTAQPTHRPARGGGKRPRWTPREDSQLAARVRAGFNLTTVAEMHGRTRTAVQLRIAMLGIRIPTWRFRST